MTTETGTVRLGWRKLRGADFVRRNVLLLALIMLIVVVQVLNPSFLSVDNIRGILLDLSILLILSVPAGLLLIAGYVDFSVGSVIGLSSVTAGLVLTKAGMPTWLALIVTLAVAAIVGVVNGLLVTVIGFSPIIVTLGTLSLVAGITLGIGSIPTVGYPAAFQDIGGARIAGIPVPVIIALVVIALGAFVMWRLPVGRHIPAIGSNREAAYLSALRVRTIPLLLYVLTAGAAGLGGIVTAARLDTASAGTGTGFELTLLTALLLGGVSFFGGSGSLGGIVVGVLFLGVLQNALVVLGAPGYVQQTTTGVVLIIAAALNFFAERRR